MISPPVGVRPMLVQSIAERMNVNELTRRHKRW